MQFLYLCLFAAGIVAVDQVTKFLTVAHIALYQDVELIPGVLGLTYVRNTGAAFSSFAGMQWLFAVIFVAQFFPMCYTLFVEIGTFFEEW